MIRGILFIGLVCAGCSKPAEPANLDQFVGKPGVLEKACRVENDGKRFVVEGVLTAPDTIELKDDHIGLRLSLDEEAVGFEIELQAGKHITVESGAMKRDWRSGFGGKSGVLKSVALHTKSGDAELEEPLRVTFEAKVIQQFQTKAVTACLYRVRELERIEAR